MKNLTISDISRSVFQTQLQAIQSQIDGCIEGRDPIYLHDLRVANRRIRAALDEFEDLLQKDTCTRIQRDLHWLHSVTGDVRDLDVSLAYFPDFTKNIPREWRKHLLPMSALLEEKRENAQNILKDHLTSEQLKSVMTDLTLILEDRSFAGSSLSDEPAREYGCRLIIERYRKVRAKGLKLSKKTPPEKFHAYRINIKKLRYLMEFFRPAIGCDNYERLRTGLKSVQDALGAFQDTDVQTDKVEQIALELHEAGESPETLLAMGQLLGVLEKRRRKYKKNCLRQTHWLVGDSTARIFQSCFQYPVK